MMLMNTINQFIVIILWLGILGVLLLTSAIALDVIFGAFLDTCDVSHESANTLLGWTIVSLFLVVTAGVGAFLHQLLGLSRVIVVIGITGYFTILALLLLLSGGKCQ